MFKEIVTVLMFVKDVKKSAEWYKKFLSIDPAECLDDFASFHISSFYLNLHLADKNSPVSPGGTVVYWNVDNMKEAIAKAISMGGTVYRGPLYVKETSRTIVQILDPFGNVFGLECPETI